jgi:hypothetical protein
VAASRQNVQSDVVVPNHVQKGAAQFMRQKLLLVVEAEHEVAEVAAILLQHVPAIHFDDRKYLNAGGPNCGR